MSSIICSMKTEKKLVIDNIYFVITQTVLKQVRNSSTIIRREKFDMFRSADGMVVTAENDYDLETAYR